MIFYEFCLGFFIYVLIIYKYDCVCIYFAIDFWVCFMASAGSGAVGGWRPAANKSLKLRKQLSMERTWPGSTQICLPLGGRYLEHKPSQILMQELAQTKRSSCALSLSHSFSRVESATQSGDLQVIAFLMPANGQTVQCINDSANMMAEERAT